MGRESGASNSSIVYHELKWPKLNQYTFDINMYKAWMVFLEEQDSIRYDRLLVIYGSNINFFTHATPHVDDQETAIVPLLSDPCR